MKFRAVDNVVAAPFFVLARGGVWLNVRCKEQND